MHVKYVTFTFRGAWASDLLPEDFKVGKKKIDNRVANSAEHHFRKNLYSGTHISALFSFFHKKSVGNREGRGTSGLFHDNKTHCYFGDVE